MIPMQMELGGKDSCIILEDADLELAATNIIKGGFSYRFVTYAFTSQAL
jgi:glyceraldehyde-3-phosphate dehydrogenase (NADP+)